MQTLKSSKLRHTQRAVGKAYRPGVFKALVIALTSMLSIATSQADVSKKKIGDLEIYQTAEGGNVTVLLMLDTSGSMSEPYMRTYFGVSDAATACNLVAGQAYTAFNEPYLPNDMSSPYNFTKYGCHTTQKVYDRLTNLKIALFKLLDEGGLDASKVSIGIGQFSSQSGADNVAWTTADDVTGKILVPVAKLDATQIDRIKRAVAALAGKGGTPSAHAYAEAGAYMLGTTTKDSGDAGFGYSVTASKNTSNYISPVTGSTTPTCDGRGIYFLTDGFPNNAPNPLTVMKNALGSKGAAFTGVGSPAMPQGSSEVCNLLGCTKTSGMPHVGAFSQALRTNNPYGHSILTAVVGFGSDFTVDSSTVKTLDKVKVNPATGAPLQQDGQYVYEQDDNGNRMTENYYNCAAITAQDAKNACNWGAKSHPSLPGVGGFGEGGFFSVQDDKGVVDSIKKFVADLKTELPAIAAGTIVIPDDPYRADSQLPVAYYPIIKPKIGTAAAVWPGNLKKYNLKDGTLVGKLDSALFTDDDAGNLNPATEDLWSAVSATHGNHTVEAGGVLNQLKTPASNLSNVRNLYIEDNTSATDSTVRLRKLGVNDAGKVMLDNRPLSATNTFFDTATYSKQNVHALIKFLGFDLSDSQQASDIADLVLTNPAQPRRILGATIHSTPSAVSYSATLNAEGKVTDSRDDYVLFGSSDGALHLVNADDHSASGTGGQEALAFIPKLMLQQQANAIAGGQSANPNGTPYFGIDAPWLVSATYNYNFASKKVTVTPCADDDDKPLGSRDCEVTGIYAYGGLRLGGEALYGMELTHLTDPKLLFTLTPDTAGFSRLGQIWAKPTIAKIKTSATDPGTKVLIFGGGYDTCYEDESYQVGTTTSTLTNQRRQACDRTPDTEAVGNAVYMVNAKTGALIWSATHADNTVAGATNTINTNLVNSIVGGISVLDRNNDGFMDGMYFADLGGQVFRADFTNAGFNTGTTAETAKTSFSNTRVVRLLQPAYTTAETRQYNYRFYERPVVSFYRNDSTNKLFAVVNVLSGDRSSPLSKLRNDNQYADRLYAIFDTDVTLPNAELFANDFAASVTDVADQLLALPTAVGTTAPFSLAQKNAQITVLKAGATNDGKAVHGWYYPLTRFDGFANVKYTKGIGRAEVIDSFLYTTAYNPDMAYSATEDCSAKIRGGSERQLYCLPYGICLDDASTNGTGGFMRAGQGLQELTLGPRSTSFPNQRLLIGIRSMAQRLNNRVSFGTDAGKLLQGGTVTQGLDANSQPLAGLDQTLGDGAAPEMIYNERYTFKPMTWYEVNQ